MAGVKGMKGGGGPRPGAGAKPKPPKRRKAKALETDDPDEFLRAVMRDSRADFKDRMAAALALKKAGKTGKPAGKKEQQQAAAEGVVRGLHTPLPAPVRPRAGHLRAVK